MPSFVQPTRAATIITNLKLNTAAATTYLPTYIHTYVHTDRPTGRPPSATATSDMAECSHIGYSRFPEAPLYSGLVPAPSTKPRSPTVLRAIGWAMRTYASVAVGTIAAIAIFGLVGGGPETRAAFRILNLVGMRAVSSRTGGNLEQVEEGPVCGEQLCVCLSDKRTNGCTIR